MSIKDTKIIAESAIKCLTTLLALVCPPLGLVAPTIDAAKELKEIRSCNNGIAFSAIESICKKVVPSNIAQYRDIISVAADICLKKADFLTNPYNPKNYSQILADRYIRDYNNHYDEAELERIKGFLPNVLSSIIPEVEKRLENNPKFKIEWRKVSNSRIAKIEELQKAHAELLASHEERISRQEERNQGLSPKISELSDTYFSKWDKHMFLDKSKPLRQAYQLPNYQTCGYLSDEEDGYDDIEQYDNLDKQLEDTILNCNNIDMRMLLVLGLPGSGKSTLITYLLNNLLSGATRKTRKIRIYRFSGFESSIWNSDPENIPQLMLNNMGLTKLDLSNSILILDGLDEIQMHSNHADFLNYLYGQWATAQDIKRFSLIVTCRRNRIEYLDALEMRYVLLCPFNERQIKQFASAYWEKGLSEFDSRQVGLITRICNNTKHLRDVLGIPLILYMALALEIDLSDESGLCDIYEQIFSVESDQNSIYYRRYDKAHPITYVEAERIQEFSKEVAKQIWEFNPSEGTIDKEKYEPIAKRIAPDNTDGLRDLLVGQYFMEGKEGCQLLFVHRSMYEYFVALSICDNIAEMVTSTLSPSTLYSRIPFSGGNCELTVFAATFGLQNLTDYPEIQEFMLHMLKKKRLCNPAWWKEFFSEFLLKGLSDAANNRPKGGQAGLTEELNRFYNLIWLTREQLEAHGESAPHLLSNGLCESIYLRIPYAGKKDLKSLSLKGIELMGHDFTEAKMQKTDLSKSVLNRSIFTDANLEHADLRSAEIEQATFSCAYLYKANFRIAHLKDTQFDSADLRYANFSDADLSGADFSYAKLSHVVFTGAVLIGADFSNAVIEHCIFDEAALSGANFSRLHLTHSSFVNTNFEGASLEHITVSPGTSMKNAIFSNCNLTGSDFQHVDLSFVQFENAIMDEIYLCDSDLSGANLYAAQLSGSNLEKASLVGAQLRSAVFDNSNMKYVNLENADLRGASLIYADLTNARIINTKAQSDTLDTIICAPQDRSRWIIDDSHGFSKDDAVCITDYNENEFIEVDNNVFVSKYELEAYERQYREYNESYF